MNRDGFTLLAMGFTGAKALQFKLAYIAEFNRMEEIIHMHLDPKWQKARQSAKDATRRMTDAIRDILIPLAIKQGMNPEKAHHFYNNYNRLINKLIGTKSDSRSLLTDKQLYETEKMSRFAAVQINLLASADTDYHDIYFGVKDFVQNYAKVYMF